MDVEELIFNMYKDEALISKVFKNEVMKKFGIDLKTASDLFARITNYQIERFGRKLDNFYEIPTPEENAINNRRFLQRMYMRKKRGS